VAWGFLFGDVSTEIIGEGLPSVTVASYEALEVEEDALG
jgi:hypothetical protein